MVEECENLSCSRCPPFNKSRHGNTVFVQGVQEFIDHQARANRRVLGLMREFVSKIMLESDIEKHSVLSIHVHVYQAIHMCVYNTHTHTTVTHR